MAIRFIKIGDCEDIKIRTGIMPTRILASEGTPVECSKKIILPKHISDHGTIDTDIPLQNLQKEIAPNKLAKVGDIVISLCGPYNGAIVGDKHDGAVVSSFCAVITCENEILRNYLLAFINSKDFKKEIQKQIPDRQISSAISVQTIKNVPLPVLSEDDMAEIGNNFISICEKIQKLKRQLEVAKTSNEVSFSLMFHPERVYLNEKRYSSP